MRKTGVYQRLGDLNFFVPFPLPPKDPSLEMTPEILSLYGDALFALGLLNAMSQKLPDPKRFIKAYVIKEALLSSSIEGIHTTLVDIFTQPLDDFKPNKDTQLVLNYIHALEAAVEMIEEEKLPVVLRVILKAHKVLLSSGEGDKADPGHFRRQSVRVGDHVPPPAPEIGALMGSLERYINESSDFSCLIKAGLAHVQFETIHPFLDGNGRIGRLLIVLMLIDGGLLKSPVFYPSYYFKKHHLEYYQRLDRVRTHGDFEGWIIYYLKAIRESAQDAYMRAEAIEDLEKKLRHLIETDSRFNRLRETAASALQFLFTQPVTGIAEMSQGTGKAYNTIQNILNIFVEKEIVVKTKLHKRNKIYRFEPYLKLLESDLTL